MSETDIKDVLKDLNYSPSKISFKNNRNDFTNTVFVSFSSIKDYDRIIDEGKICIGFQRYRVEKRYKLPPIQCFKCQKFGHTTLTCKSRINICRKCSGSHTTKECTSLTLICALCKGNHPASAKICPKNPLNKVKVTKNPKQISFTDKDFPPLNKEKT